MPERGLYGFPAPRKERFDGPDATPTAPGGVEVDQSPASGHPVALTAPRLGAPVGTAPLGPDGVVDSGFLAPPPASGLAELGRWTRSGTSPLVTADQTWESNWVDEPTVLYEGGTWKMWYGGGYTNRGVGYATAAAAAGPWTKHTGPVWGQGGSGFGGYAAQNCVLKVGATYWMFYADGATNLKIAQSADGLTWGAAGTALRGNQVSWASQQWANPAVWVDPAGTWHMLVEANNGTTWQIGYATSPEGLTWTVQAGPLVALQVAAGGSYGGPWVTAMAPQYGGLYQCWYHAVPASGYLPTNLYRASSPDLLTWTQTGEVLAHLGSAFEIDQVADPCVVEALGLSYLFYGAIDNIGLVGRIKLATFGGSVGALVGGSGLPATLDTSGHLPPAQGGTGLDGSAAGNGQLPIGNGAGFSLHTLTAGSNVTITNGAGTVTVASTAGGSTSPLTTKGDIWGYGTADARVPVGADGLALLADSTQTPGVRWGAPQPSSLLVLLPNPYNFIDDSATDHGQPPDFITTAAGDVVAVGGL